MFKNQKDKNANLLDKPLTRAILVLFGLASIFLIWYLISLIIENYILDDGVLNIFFPGPEVVIPVFFKMMGESETYVNIAYTIARLLLSFAFSFVLAFIFGAIAGVFKSFEIYFKPVVVVMRTLPPAVLILSLLMFMRYDYALFVIVLLVMFPILYEAVLSGFKNIDHDILQATRLETKIYSPNSMFKVLVPCARPYVFLGVVQTLGLGLKVSIMAEVLLGSAKCKGIGVAFYIAKLDLRYDVMFSYSIYAILIIALLDYFLGLVKRKIKADLR